MPWIYLNTPWAIFAFGSPLQVPKSHHPPGRPWDRHPAQLWAEPARRATVQADAKQGAEHGGAWHDGMGADCSMVLKDIVRVRKVERSNQIIGDFRNEDDHGLPPPHIIHFRKPPNEHLRPRSLPTGASILIVDCPLVTSPGTEKSYEILMGGDIFFTRK